MCVCALEGRNVQIKILLKETSVNKLCDLNGEGDFPGTVSIEQNFLPRIQNLVEHCTAHCNVLLLNANTWRTRYDPATITASTITYNATTSFYWLLLP